MSARTDFITWCDQHENDLHEALPAADEPQPHYVPQPGFMRGAVDLWKRATGKGPTDWAARQAQNLAWQRKRTAAMAAGDPDDPTTRQRKMNDLIPIFQQAIKRSLPGAGSITKGSAVAMSQPFADMFTMGKPITPSPLVSPTKGQQSVMGLVHADPDVGETIKGKNGPWSTPFNVLRDVLFPAFNANQNVWYDPNASQPQDRRPPGSTPDENAWRAANTAWQTTGTGQQRREFGKDELLDVLTKRGIKKDDLTPNRLEQMVQEIIDQMKADGHFVTVDEEDKAIVKATLAANITDNTYDVMKLLFAHNKFMRKQQLLYWVREVEKRIRAVGREPNTDWPAITQEFLQSEDEAQEFR
jgi:hypothetical protein